MKTRYCGVFIWPVVSFALILGDVDLSCFCDVRSGGSDFVILLLVS